MKRSRWAEALTILALLAAILPGCETIEKCPPSFADVRPGCTEIPACSRNRVHVFLIAGFDPLCGMDVLREGLIEHGFIKVYCAPRLYGKHYVKEIQRLRAADEEARFVIVAQGSANVTARSVADAAGTPIDLVVLLDRTGEGPVAGQRVLFMCGEKGSADDDKVAEVTVRLPDGDWCDTAKHPQTAEVIAHLLGCLAAKIPVVEQGPKCELADCPPCGNGWDFLRPDGHDSGCIQCKPMNLAAGTTSATTPPATSPERLPLPKGDRKPSVPAANQATKPRPIPTNKPFVLPPPPTLSQKP